MNAFFLLFALVMPSNENLVINGDFELGNQDFTTEYEFVDDGNGPPGTGRYGVTTNPSFWHPQFDNISDHSDQNGMMMVVNSSTVQNQIVWEQTINVDRNSSYKIALCAANISPNPVVTVFCNSNPLFVADLNPGASWVTTSAIWESTANDQLIMTIENASTMSSANDFTLDNISVRLFLLGDVNLDCQLDLLDVNSFVELIVKGGFSLEADINNDGMVNLGDVAGFVALLTGG